MTPRTDSLEIERRIAARPETVFSFFVDPELLKDPATAEVRTITLSYTMYPERQTERPRAQNGADSAAGPS